MILKVLSENTSRSEELGSEHGLSLYLETEKHKILFDMGASSLFAENAEKMGVDLAQVDLAVISHGHYDHGGGLRTFLQINQKAKVYAHQDAFGKYYAREQDNGKTYVGLDDSLLSSDRLLLCGNHVRIDDELELFAGVTGARYLPAGNVDLLKQEGVEFMRDNFSHEQNLIIHEAGKKLLISGCAHSGIVNILEDFKEKNGCFPDAVIGGFHLYNPVKGVDEDPDKVDAVGQFMIETKAKYFTCHCTGQGSYQRLKGLMDGQIEYIATGDQWNI